MSGSTGVGVKLKEILGWKKSGDLGLELEVESSEALPEITQAPWKTKLDESLRGFSKEYVTDGAIPCDKTKTAAVEYLCGELAKIRGLDKHSPRTSLHVHVNVLEFTPLQIWTAATTYWLLENLLLEYCGEDRKGNLFCLRLKDAEGMIRQVQKDIEYSLTNQPFGTINSNSGRYSSQNISAIRKFGSLEYRGMRGVVDAYTIDLWSSSMYSLVHKSKRYKSPEDMLNTYIKVGADAFLRSVLPDELVSHLQSFPGWKNSVDENAGLICELCYSEDWDRWGVKVNKICTSMGMYPRTHWIEAPDAREATRNITRTRIIADNYQLQIDPPAIPAPRSIW